MVLPSLVVPLVVFLVIVRCWAHPLELVPEVTTLSPPRNAEAAPPRLSRMAKCTAGNQNLCGGRMEMVWRWYGDGYPRYLRIDHDPNLADTSYHQTIRVGRQW
jgi:hypothetical protein